MALASFGFIRKTNQVCGRCNRYCLQIMYVTVPQMERLVTVSIASGRFEGVQQPELSGAFNGVLVKI
jgi:hypothetical protein